MSIFHSLLLLIASSIAVFGSNECPNGETSFTLKITPDKYYSEENTWKIEEVGGSVVFQNPSERDSNASELRYDYCLDQNQCFEFTITDYYNDGIEGGGYRLFYNDQLIYSRDDVFSEDSVRFGDGCPSFFPSSSPLPSHKRSSFPSSFPSLPLFPSYKPTSSSSLACPTGKAPISLEITPDTYYSYENNWKIEEVGGSVVFQNPLERDSNASELRYDYCLDQKKCFVFTITDYYNDGIDGGGYRLFYNDQLIHLRDDVFSEDSVLLGDECPSFFPSSSPSSSNEPSLSSKPSLSSSPTNSPYPMPETPLLFFGDDPHQFLLPECGGHCKTDDECSFGLFCYKGNNKTDKSIPGCDTVPYPNVNYCVKNELHPSSAPSTLPFTILPSKRPSKSSSSMPSLSFSPSKSQLPSLIPTQLPTIKCPAWKQLGGLMTSGPTIKRLSISSEGDTVVFCTLSACHRYSYDDDSWSKRDDSSQIVSCKVVAISSNGNVIATRSKIGSNCDGPITMYKLENGSWIQFGENVIDFGVSYTLRSAAMSPNGDVISFANTYKSGQVRIFAVKSSSWIQLGENIEDDDNVGGIVEHVTMANENVVAIFYYSDDIELGMVCVYAFDKECNSWKKVGEEIEIIGKATGLRLSSSGKELAVFSDHVRVYSRNKTSWHQYGDDINVESLIYSVSISPYGTQLSLYTKAFAVKVYVYNESSHLWTQLGSDIDGEVNFFKNIHEDMSLDGSIVAMTQADNSVKVMKLHPCDNAPTSTPSIAPLFNEFNCSLNETSLSIAITTDRFPNETSWVVTNLLNEIVFSGGPYKSVFTLYNEIRCLKTNECYQFSILDSNNDGICCHYYFGYGNYKLYYNNELLRDDGNFTAKESTFLGTTCPSVAPSLQPSSESCQKGTFTNADNGLCQPCNAGEYQNKTGAKSCKKCAKGEVQPKVGQTSCVKCPVGEYQDQMGERSCKDCRPGEYQDDQGQENCKKCGAGQYQPIFGAKTCIDCRVGGYCNDDGRNKCDGGFIPCSKGTFNDKKGQSNEAACRPCPTGEYSDQPGLSRCSLCAYRLSSFKGNEVCTVCAEEFYLNDKNKNSTSLQQQPDAHCFDCPKNGECSSNTTLETIGVEPGFWRDSLSTSTIYPCNHKGICIGFTKKSRRLLQTTHPNCQEGYSGPLCEVCVESNKYFDNKVGRCKDCPPFSKLAIIPASILAIIAFIVLINLASIRSTSFKHQLQWASGIISSISIQAKIKVLISFFQVIVTLEAVYGVIMDKKFKAWFNFLKVFNFKIWNNIAVPEQCLGSMETQLIIYALWPYGAICIIIISVVAYTMIFHKREDGDKVLREKICSRSLHLTIIILYLVLPSVCNDIFKAIKCRSFDTDDKSYSRKSYLLADWNVECDRNISSYNDLIKLFWSFFVLWPILVPSIFFTLLWSIRKPVRSQRTTVLSEACRFLWRDYNKNMMFWEVLDLFRKIFLTGFIMFIETEEGSSRIFRLIIAIVISTFYFGLLALARPYKRNDDLYLSYGSNMLLVFCFLLGILIQICGPEDGSCERFVSPFFDNAYQATLASVILTAVMLGITVLVIIFLVRKALNAPTVRLVSTNSLPNLELPHKCKSHAFISHIWATGQDKAHKIVRMLQLVLPGIRVWLDVDDLNEMSQLEESVEETAVFLLLYTKGYFQSKNCIREVSAAVAAKKPTFVLYEGDGTVIDVMREECNTYFSQVGQNQAQGDMILEHILTNDPILWLGSSMQYFASESVKLLILNILRHLQYYLTNSAELSLGLKLGNELGPMGVRSTLHILYCKDNEGARCVAEEVMRESRAGDLSVADVETTLDSNAFDPEGMMMLLYLNKNIFLDSDGRVKDLVKEALDNGIKIVLAHEQDSEKGGCHFSGIITQTSQELLDQPYSLYKDIAIPLYALKEYRTLSLRLLFQKMGAQPCTISSSIRHRFYSQMYRGSMT